MDEGAFDRLALKHGEPPTAAHLRQLEALVARNSQLAGPGLLRRIYPWGTHRSYRRTGGLVSAPVFAPDVQLAGTTAQVRWTGPRALIGGVAPTIGDVEIFDDTTDDRAALAVDSAAFAASGTASIFFKVVVDPSDFTINTVTPVALAKPPVNVPYTAHLLALFLRLDGSSIDYDESRDRQLFSAQGFYAANRRTNGVFTPIFWATF